MVGNRQQALDEEGVWKERGRFSLFFPVSWEGKVKNRGHKEQVWNGERAWQEEGGIAPPQLLGSLP